MLHIMNVRRMELRQHAKITMDECLWLLTWDQRLSERERLRESKDLGVVDGSSGTEGFSGQKMTSEKLDVTEADFKKAGYDGDSELDSHGLLGENS